MILAAVQDILDDLGFDSSLVNITKATSRALNLATQALAAKLETDFTQSVTVDTFFVSRPTMMQRWDNFYTEFKLSQGFVNASPALVSIYADSTQFLAGGVAGGAAVDNSTCMSVNLEKGIATDMLTEYGRQWVQFTYTKGFPTVSADANGNIPYDPSVVPQWLQEAARLKAIIYLQSNPSLEDPQIKMDAKMLMEELGHLIKPHLRYAPSATLPVITTFSGVETLATATVAPQIPGGIDENIVGIDGDFL